MEQSVETREIVVTCGACGAAEYSDGSRDPHATHCAELRPVYLRMPQQHRELLDNVPFGPTHHRLLELYAIIERRKQDGTQQRLELEIAAEAEADARRRDEVFVKRASKGAFGEAARAALEECVRQVAPGTSRETFLKAARAAIEHARSSR